MRARIRTCLCRRTAQLSWSRTGLPCGCSSCVGFRYTRKVPCSAVLCVVRVSEDTHEATRPLTLPVDCGAVSRHVCIGFCHVYPLKLHGITPTQACVATSAAVCLHFLRRAEADAARSLARPNGATHIRLHETERRVHVCSGQWSSLRPRTTLRTRG